MFKKLISSFLLNCMLLTSANAATTSGLKTAFDNLSYALTVEWDQEDLSFAQTELNKFKSELRALQAEGLTQTEMTAFMKQLLKGKADAEVDAFVQDLDANALTEEEAAARLNSMIAKAYGQGAQFMPTAGKVVLIVVGAAATIFLAGLLMWELSDPQVFDEDTEWK